MSSFWNERYSASEYVYGTAPNVFFAEQLSLLKPGTLILPCEGEGRNAVFAARKGWQVLAFDSSEEGKNKAQKLASKNDVTISYLVDNAENVNYEPNSADAIALIYAHFSTEIRTRQQKNSKLA